MDQARPLRAVFDELLSDDAARQAHAADPDGTLSAAGHADLPGELVAEAIVSFADTAPVEVAEHLAPYVISHSALPLDTADDDDDDDPVDPMDGLDLLTTAPEPVAPDAVVDPAAAAEAAETAAAETAAEPYLAPDDLGFGAGSDWLEPVTQQETTDAGVDIGVDMGAAGDEDETVSSPDELPTDELPFLGELPGAVEIDADGEDAIE